MINVNNNYKQALTQPRTIDAKITYNSTTINIDNINSIKRSFNSTLFKTIAKQVIIDSNVSIDKDKTINPQFGLYLDNQFEYISLGSYKVKNAPNLNKDTNSYEITAYDKIVDSMVDYGLTNSDITYPCTVRQLFVAIFTKLGWSTSGIPTTFVNSTSQIEEDVYSNVNMTYRDVLDELCTISCMFLIDINGTPTLKQKTTTSETINEDFMSDTNVKIKNQVFFNSLVFSRASNSDNIYRKDDTSIANNGLHEFKVSDLQILSLNWRDNFIDAMWNYIKTFTYYAYEVNTGGITYLEPIDTFTLSTFGSTYSTILLNSDLTIANGVNEKIYANEPLESETEYKYADTTDKRINQTYLIVDKQQGQINAVVSQVDEIEQDLSSPTNTLAGEYFDLEDALDQPLQDFSLYGDTQQDSTTGKNILDFADRTITSQVATSPINVSHITGKITLSFDYKNTGNVNGVARIRETGQTTNLASAVATANTTDSSSVSLDVTNYNSLTIYFQGTSSGYNYSVSKVQLEKGSTKTSYEPYTNGASPNPDYPQEIHNVSGDNTIEICGKNLYKPFSYSRTNNGVDFSCNLDGTITANNTSTNTAYSINSTIALEKKFYMILNAGTYTLSGGISSSKRIELVKINDDETVTTLASSTTTSDTFTINEIVRAFIRVRIAGNIETNDTFYPMLEKGSTATEYEAYTGNSQLISLGVENLFDYSTNIIESASFNNSTMKIVSDNNSKLSYCECLPNTTYTISRRNPIAQRFHIATTETTPQINSNILSFDYNNSATSITITTPSNAHYIVVRFIYNEKNDYETYAKTIQIEKGSKANSYSEYGKPYIELCKIDTYQDYIYKDNDRWYLHKEIGKVVLDGSESWSKSSNTSVDRFIQENKRPDLVVLEALSNYFTYNLNSTNSGTFYLQYSTDQYRGRIVVNFSSYGTTTLEQFKTWLSTHNTEVYYVLATPTDTEITDTTLLEQLNRLMTLPLYKNMTHITLTPNDLQPTMNIEYLRDTSINNNFVPKEDMTKYYTKTETNAQIKITGDSISSEVARVEEKTDANNKYTSRVETSVTNLQTDTKTLLTFKQNVEQNGVETLKNTLIQADINGLSITKGESFRSQITDRTLEVNSNNKELIFLGYDDNLKKTVARMDWIESEHATIGAHRTETITKNGKKRTAGFYVGGGN